MFNKTIVTVAICLFLQLSHQCFGEAKAVIKGPKEVLAGTLLFLSYEDSVGDNKVWMIPDDLKNTAATCGSNIFFSIPTPGTYKFTLIVADKEANISYATQEVVVKASLVPTPSPETPETKPPAPVDTASITAVSKSGVIALNDSTTTRALQTVLTSVITKFNDDLPTAKSMVSSSIETTFLFRSAESRSKDWLNLWRKPVEDEIKKLNPTTSAQYKEAIKAVIRGLCIDGTCPNIP